METHVNTTQLLRFGPLKGANANVRLTGPCTDTAEFWLILQDGMITDAKATSDGCKNSIRACCTVADLVVGKSEKDARNLTVQDVLKVLGEYPESSIHCIELALNTMRATLDDGHARHSSAFDELEQLPKPLPRTEEVQTIMVMSGKGGVGKSTVAVNLAVSLASFGYRVGLIDVDLHGPSIPTMLNLHDVQVLSDGQGKMQPVVLGDLFGLQVISLGFLLEHDDDPVIWRGPLKHSLIGQFLNDVDWQDVDFLIVDCPPGTGDEPLSVVQQNKHKGKALLVTTPQDVATADVSRSINFCKQLELPIVGIVENMSGFECPYCHRNTPIFKTGGGKNLADEYSIPFLGSIPIESAVGISTDAGLPIVQRAPESASARGYRSASIAVVKNLTLTRSES
ncbi:MAG: P-loop NTPase [Sphaerochaetaceae bacterium]